MKVIKVNYSWGSQKYLIFSDYEDFLSYLDYNWKSEKDGSYLLDNDGSFYNNHFKVSSIPDQKL